MNYSPAEPKPQWISFLFFPDILVTFRGTRNNSEDSVSSCSSKTHILIHPWSRYLCDEFRCEVMFGAPHHHHHHHPVPYNYILGGNSRKDGCIFWMSKVWKLSRLGKFCWDKNIQGDISTLEIGSSLYRWEVLGDVNFRRKEVPCTPSDGKVPDHGSSAALGQ